MLSQAFQASLPPRTSLYVDHNDGKTAFPKQVVRGRPRAAKRARPPRHLPWSLPPTANAGRAFSPQDAEPGWENSPFLRNEVVASKYTITDMLGRGANGITYEAALLGERSASKVALKALSFKAMSNWKTLDLFEREARTLRALSHPAIPAYIDFFEVDSAGDRVFVLVQRKAPGVSLQRLLDDGQRFTTEQVRAAFQKLLEVLQYLASLNPPVLHRDVKPSNVILDLRKRGEPHLSLVDFGGVNTGVAGGSSGSLGSTMIGTFGYMAPEQFSGAADVRSDLYAAAATVLYMLTGRSPSSLPQKRLKIDVESVVPERERSKLGNVYLVMSKLLEPAPEDRYDSPNDALDALAGKFVRGTSSSSVVGSTSSTEGVNVGIFGGAETKVSLSADEAASLQAALANINSPDAGRRSSGPIEMLTGWAGRQMRRRKPSGSRVVLERDRENRLLQVTIPAKGMSGTAVSKGAFAMAWTGFTAFWTVGVLTGGAPVVFSLFSIPFWAAGVQMVRGAVEEVVGGAGLVVSFGGGEREVFYFGMCETGLGRGVVAEGDSRDLTAATVETSMYVNGQAVTELVVQEGTRRHVLGRALDEVEKTWLRDEINDFLTSQYRRR